MDDVVFNAENHNLTQTLATIGGYHILENVVLTITGFLILIVNVVFLLCAIDGLRSKRLPWKRYILAVNLALADFLVGIALTMLNVVIIIYNVHYPDLTIPSVPLDCFIVITYGSIILTIVIHVSLSIIQYIALKHPFFYRISIRKQHCFAICGGSWLLAIAFSGFQAYFWFTRVADRKLEVTHLSTAGVIGLGILLNVMLNAYVVYIACQKYAPNLKSYNPFKSTNSDTSLTSTPEPSAAVVGSGQKSANWSGSQLAATMTHLLKELAYLLTTIPLWTLLLYEFIAGKEPFETNMTPGLFISVLFLFRSIADPLILLIRETRLLPECGKSRRKNTESRMDTAISLSAITNSSTVS